MNTSSFLKENGKQITDDCWWYRYLTVNVGIAVKECGKAVRFLEKKLGGNIKTLSPEHLMDLGALFDHHKINCANCHFIWWSQYFVWKFFDIQ